MPPREPALREAMQEYDRSSVRVPALNDVELHSSATSDSPMGLICSKSSRAARLYSRGVRGCHVTQPFRGEVMAVASSAPHKLASPGLVISRGTRLDLAMARMWYRLRPGAGCARRPRPQCDYERRSCRRRC